MDEALLEIYRTRPCEICGKRFPIEAAHITNDGLSRKLHSPLNLLSLCGGPDGCHARHHSGKILPRVLIAVVAAREGMKFDEVQEELWRLKR